MRYVRFDMSVDKLEVREDEEKVLAKFPPLIDKVLEEPIEGPKTPPNMMYSAKPSWKLTDSG